MNSRAICLAYIAPRTSLWLRSRCQEEKLASARKLILGRVVGVARRRIAELELSIAAD